MNHPIRPRHSARLSVLLCAAFLISFLPVAREVESAQLRNRDLRFYGYKRAFSGRALGSTSKFNLITLGLDVTPQNFRATQRFPQRTRTVAGPDGNLFQLTFQPPKGNRRRAISKGVYSGSSFNPFYGITTFATGSYKFVIRRSASGRLRGSITDRFTERDQFGATANAWDLSAPRMK